LGTGSATVSEGTAATGPITHNFTGQFQTGGALVAPTSSVIAFTDAGGGISDILTFNYGRQTVYSGSAYCIRKSWPMPRLKGRDCFANTHGCKLVRRLDGERPET
jgi:hypothetical protein